MGQAKRFPPPRAGEVSSRSETEGAMSNVMQAGFSAIGLIAAAVAFPAMAADVDAPVPDLSGIWAHLTWPDVEPPLAGPGPVRNRSRVNNISGLGNNGSVSIASTPNGVGNPYELVGDYTNPILKPEAAAIVKSHGDISQKGVPYPTPSNQCWPGGVPFVFWNLGMQMIQQSGEVTILYANDHEVRHVRMNEAHPAQLKPSWYGDSVGHYEGGTLVIDTVGVKVGPFAMVDMYGTPHSEALHVVERYSLLDYEAANAAEERGEKDNFRLPQADSGLARNPNYKGPGLQLSFTVEDPAIFTTVWSAAIIYRRPLGDWPEVACAEHPDGYFPGKHADVPTADKPDF
jgi:hypothetical protein